MKMKKFALRGLIVLAVVVALCIFFSGTVRTLTTPKVRLAQVKMGKMEQETELTGKVVFPETEELILDVPEGMTLTVTRVHVSAGEKVKEGTVLVSAKVTDGAKQTADLEKELASTRRELRTSTRKAEAIRLTRGEKRWQEAWEKEAEAQNRTRNAMISLQAALSQAGLKMENDQLPADAGEELTALYEAWKKAAEQEKQASELRVSLDRYAISDESWTVLQQQKEQSEKVADLEKQLMDLQVLDQTASQIKASRTAYVTEVSVEKGSAIDGNTVILKLTAENADPVIRMDLSQVKQEVAPGASITLEAESWSRPVVKVINTGLSLEGHPYADAEITSDVTYSLGNMATLMKNDIKGKLTVRSSESTCLLPAAAVRGSGEDRYVYLGETQSTAFGGSQMKVVKMKVTVLAESGTTVSVAEDLTYQKVLYMEDRALTEDGAVMEYVKDTGK